MRTPFSRPIARVLIVIAGGTLACDSSEPTGPREPVASVVLAPQQVEVFVGDTTRLTATPRDAAGRPLPGRTISWTSADPTIATVSPAGIVTAHRAATTKISASAEGKVAHADVTVRVGSTYDLIYSGSTSPFGLARLYVLPPGGPAAPLVPSNVLADWTLTTPAAAPDGRRIAFTAQRGGEAYIYLVNSDGSGLRQVTTGGREGGPSWSPDGSRIAYGSNGDIWVMDDNGSNPVNITGHLPYVHRHAAAWSPQLAGGTLIAFSEGSFDARRLVTIRPDGRDLRAITNGWLDDEPAWSPDGTQLVFTRERDASGPDLWIVNLTTGAQAPLVELRGTQANPAWSPDGRMIAFTSLHEPGSLFDVFTVESDGRNIVRRSAPAYGVHPAWRMRR